MLIPKRNLSVPSDRTIKFISPSKISIHVNRTYVGKLSPFEKLIHVKRTYVGELSPFAMEIGKNMTSYIFSPTSS